MSVGVAGNQQVSYSQLDESSVIIQSGDRQENKPGGFTRAMKWVAKHPVKSFFITLGVVGVTSGAVSVGVVFTLGAGSAALPGRNTAAAQNVTNYLTDISPQTPTTGRETITTDFPPTNRSGAPTTPSGCSSKKDRSNKTKDKVHTGQAGEGPELKTSGAATDVPATETTTTRATSQNTTKKADLPTTLTTEVPETQRHSTTGSSTSKEYKAAHCEGEGNYNPSYHYCCEDPDNSGEHYFTHAQLDEAEWWNYWGETCPDKSFMYGGDKACSEASRTEFSPSMKDYCAENFNATAKFEK